MTKSVNAHKRGVPSSPPTQSPPPAAASALGRRLGLKAEPASDADWQLSLVVKNKQGKVVRARGPVTARKLRQVVISHQMRMESRRVRVTGSGKVPPPLSPSRITRYKRLEGEQNSLKLPLIALHKRWGKFIRGGARAVAWVADAITFPLRDVKGKQIVSGKILMMGLILPIAAVVCWVAATYMTAAAIHYHINFVIPLLGFLRWGLPVILLLAGVMSGVAGFRLKAGRSFKSLLKDWHSPQPAWTQMPVFRLGTIRKLMKDFYEGTICFGGVGSGKTASFIAPLLLQLLRKLNNPNGDAADARFFGLFLDVKGNFADLTTYLMLQVGRPLSDLIMVDPDLDLYRWNPLDAESPDFAERGAATLAAVNRIMGNESKGENVYWDQTSQNVIRYILKNLSIVRSKRSIGLDDVGRYVRDDDRVYALLKQAAIVLDYRRRNNQIGSDEFDENKQAISELKNNWARLDGRTKNILKTTIANMLGPIPTTPRLQRIFCRDTNFSMKDVINEGKIVIFRARTLDPQTARMLAVCLKRDFQIWCKRRNEITFGLNTSRSGVFLADEFQETVTCGGEGDESFFGLCREAKIMCIVATQLRSSLDVAIKNEGQLKTLLGNLTTKVFLKLSDKDTQELGAFHAGKHYRERERATIHKGGLLGAMVSNSKDGGREVSSNVDEQLEDFFRPDDFAKLRTVDKMKSTKGPYYSEAIIYNYSEDDVEKVSWAEKTKLHHLYPNKKEMSEAALRLDDLLHARNAQARVHRMFFYLVATGEAARKRAVLECDSQRQNLEAKLNAQAERKRDAQPRSILEMVESLRTRVAQLEKEDKAAHEELLAYERTQGRHGRDYARLHDKANKAAAEYTAVAVQWKIATSPTSSPIFAGGRETVGELLKGRTIEEILTDAVRSNVPDKVREGSDSDLAKHGPTAGVVPTPGTPNAHEIQSSAIPGKGETAKPAPAKANSSPAPAQQGNDTSVPEATSTPTASTAAASPADELTALVQAALQAPASHATGYERQLREHEDRFRDENLDGAYNVTFPAERPIEARAIPAAPPPLVAPATNVPLGDPNATAAVVDQALRTSEDDYS